MRGIVAVPASADDGEFLKAVARRIPTLLPWVEAVNRARASDTAKRDFAAVGQALATIEEQLQSTPSTRS
jgi:Ser/Thr protein kinase RdoA (MazF antagonist)